MLEQQRDRAAVERARARRSLLEGEGAIQQGGELICRELCAVEEMQSAGVYDSRVMRIVVIIVLGVAFAACGGDDSDSGGGSGSSGASASSGNCPSGAVTIHMKDIKFNPGTASAKVGQTICWVNDDSVDHDAVADSGADFKSDLFGKGKTFTAKADKAGTIKYECTIHPGMTGEITVK
jgi:plastocyanin